MFTDASKYIYQATRRRAFFRNVTIIVPNAWTPHPQYGPLGYHNHDVIITPTNRHWPLHQTVSRMRGTCSQHLHWGGLYN